MSSHTDSCARGGLRAKRSRTFSLIAALLVIGSLSAVVPVAATASVRSQSTSFAKKPVVGGQIEVVQAGLTWADLDPGVSPTAASDGALEDAIFDSLFNLGSKG